MAWEAVFHLTIKSSWFGLPHSQMSMWNTRRAGGCGQVAGDYTANCGNMTGAVAPFAIEEGLLPATAL
jgi:hypothetical protein